MPRNPAPPVTTGESTSRPGRDVTADVDDGSPSERAAVAPQPTPPNARRRTHSDHQQAGRVRRPTDLDRLGDWRGQPARCSSPGGHRRATLAYWLDRYGMEPAVLERLLQLVFVARRRRWTCTVPAGRGRAYRHQEAVRAAAPGNGVWLLVDGSGAVRREVVRDVPVTSSRGVRSPPPSSRSCVATSGRSCSSMARTSASPLQRPGRRPRRRSGGGYGSAWSAAEFFDLVVAADGPLRHARVAMPGRANIRSSACAWRTSRSTATTRTSTGGGGRPPKRSAVVRCIADRRVARVLLSFLFAIIRAARITPPLSGSCCSKSSPARACRPPRAGRTGARATLVLRGHRPGPGPDLRERPIGLLGDASLELRLADQQGGARRLALLERLTLAGELARRDDHREAFAAYEAVMRAERRK